MSAPPGPVPGWEGRVGPGPGGYREPHVYARDVTSGAGNCVCGADRGHARHVPDHRDRAGDELARSARALLELLPPDRPRAERLATAIHTWEALR